MLWVPYCLPTPPFVSIYLLHCWMVAGVPEHIIWLVLSLTNCLHITSTLEQLHFLWPAAKGGPPGLALETINSTKIQTKISTQHMFIAAYFHYTKRTVTSCAHIFEYGYPLLLLLLLLSWHNARRGKEEPGIHCLRLISPTFQGFCIVLSAIVTHTSTS